MRKPVLNNLWFAHFIFVKFIYTNTNKEYPVSI